jgi:hypothetical protein
MNLRMVMIGGGGSAEPVYRVFATPK